MAKRVRISRIHFKTIMALNLGLWVLVIGAVLALQAALKHDSRSKVGMRPETVLAA